MLIDYENHCSFNRDIRNLYYLKRSINYSTNYSEKEKRRLTKSLEDEVIAKWNKIRLSGNERMTKNND